MSSVIEQFRQALQAINEQRPNQGQLTPEQEELNRLRLGAARQVSEQSVPQLGARDQFLSAIQGMSKGISGSTKEAGSGLIGLGGGLTQGIGDFQAEQRRRELANLNNNSQKLQLLNATKVEQPDLKIGSAANLATAGAADERMSREIESRDRATKSKFEAEMAKLNKKAEPTLEDKLKLKDRYDKETEQTVSALRSKEIVDKAYEDPTGLKLVGATYAFLKAIDSDSVVRPSELELATGAVSTLSTLGNTLKRLYEDGKPVPKEVVEQLKPAMDAYFEAAMNRQKFVDKKWTEFAQRNNVPVKDVIFNEQFQEKEKKPAPSSQSAPIRYPNDPEKQARWEAFYNSKMTGQ